MKIPKTISAIYQTDPDKMNFGKQGCKIVTNIYCNTYPTNYWYIVYHGSSHVGTETPSTERGQEGKN